MANIPQNCPNCNAEIESGFEICWKCQYNFVSKKIEMPVGLAQNQYYTSLNCLRCDLPMVFAGTRKIQERIHWTTIGNVLELLTNTDSFDLFVCPQCNKVEFFVFAPPGAERIS